jgi:hypothetical protein
MLRAISGKSRTPVNNRFTRSNPNAVSKESANLLARHGSQVLFNASVPGFHTSRCGAGALPS